MDYNLYSCLLKCLRGIQAMPRYFFLEGTSVALPKHHPYVPTTWKITHPGVN